MAAKKAKQPGKPGRPSSYTLEIAESICTRLAGGESLVRICEDDGMPHRITVIRWTETNADFATKCARAREAQADFLHDDMASLEERTLSGQVDPQIARVVLSSKQWRAAKLAPKKYGDKVTQEHTGPDGGPVVNRIELVPLAK